MLIKLLVRDQFPNQQEYQTYRETIQTLARDKRPDLIHAYSLITEYSIEAEQRAEAGGAR